jgi:hypothetical protein
MEEALKSNSPCFKTVGERLSAQGLVSVYSGNLSIRIHDKLIITRSGSALSTIRVERSPFNLSEYSCAGRSSCSSSICYCFIFHTRKNRTM